MTAREIESIALDEVRRLQGEVRKRRTELMQIPIDGDHEERLARVWALGFIEDCLWRLERRFEGRGFID